jgi:hypothetical protein
MSLYVTQVFAYEIFSPVLVYGSAVIGAFSVVMIGIVTAVRLLLNSSDERS